jgi:hypothetical protein
MHEDASLKKILEDQVNTAPSSLACDRPSPWARKPNATKKKTMLGGADCYKHKSLKQIFSSLFQMAGGGVYVASIPQ